jgi:hypothetical protein
MTMPGIYRHYKGGFYRALGVALMSTNGPDVGDRVVVYISLTYGSMHVRDEGEFNEIVKWTDDKGRTRTDRRFFYVHPERFPGPP